ncbi:MAG: ATP-dependent Clp protease adaptor ClpS [Planctomycetota bacterium]
MPEDADQPEASADTVAAPEAPASEAERDTKPRGQTETKDNPEPPPRHAVILHNDPYSAVNFVIATLVKVLKIDATRATYFTETAHRTGKCAVWTGAKEHAEMKSALITAEGPDPSAKMLLGSVAQPLKTTIEPVPGS